MSPIRRIGNGAPNSDAPVAAQPRVLLADDNGATRLIASALLAKAGCKVTETRDGEQVLELVRAGHEFDLAVFDLNMPVIGGRTLLRTMRAEQLLLSMPVMILTASSDVDLERELRDEGVDDFLLKPFDPDDFVERVRATLLRAAA